MTTSLSSKGQIVLPAKVRRQLALTPGQKLDIRVERNQGMDRIVITQNTPRRRKMKIITDPITKLPILKGPPGAPQMTSAMVKELLADFP
jgi:AbrB family looped-hinge helix DNA binding protein